MKKTHTRKRMAVLVVLLGAAWAWAAIPPESGQESHADHDHSGHVHEAGDHEGHDHDGEAHEHSDASSVAHDKLCKEQLPAALAAVDKASTAVKFGDKKTALAELARLKKLILEIQKGIETHAQPVFANSRCPIMGNKIDPAKITIGKSEASARAICWSILLGSRDSVTCKRSLNRGQSSAVLNVQSM